ncbi:MAG: hypothetical protein MK135_06610 [Polyangiaceae bacterium]|nr:hypothetical protein [Polyangiaceae bacterium]
MKLQIRLSLLFLVLSSFACSGTTTSDDQKSTEDFDSSSGSDGVPCSSESDCDDGEACNGIEACEEGFCVAGEAVECGANEVCSEDTGQCEIICDADGDSFESINCGGSDCDDGDPNVYPGNEEFCTDDSGDVIEAAMLRDEDCDPSTLGSDRDGDGYFDSRCANRNLEGRAIFGVDCDDRNDLRRPGFSEICDGLDNDCNGLLDYPGEDNDGDGFADCNDLVGQPQYDCDDSDATRNPGVTEELCDGVDRDCDGVSEDSDGDGVVAVDASCSGGNLPKLDCDDEDSRLSCPLSVYRGAMDCEESCKPSCEPSYADCNDSLVDGCETDLRFSADNCGACGNACDWGCSQGECQQPIAVSVGASASCVTLNSGRVVCWGRNFLGVLGRGSDTNQILRPGYVSFKDLGSGVADLAVGDSFACALRNNQRVSCWGYDSSGQVGDGSPSAPKLEPVQLTRNNISQGKIVALSTGPSAACAVRSDGRLFCWGANTNGLQGRGSSDSAATTQPTRLTDDKVDENTLDVAVGTFHACALTEDHHLACWGRNEYGELGNSNASSADRLTPLLVERGVVNDNIRQVVVGALHTCALRDDQSVACWGDGRFGQLGDGVSGGSHGADSPQLVDGLPSGTIVELSAGTTHTCVLYESGALYCWGYNNFGQVGDGTTVLVDEPKEIIAASGSNPVIDMSAKFDSTCVLRQQGGVSCWGRNLFGQADPAREETTLLEPSNIEHELSQTVALTGTSDGTYALSDRGDVFAWGHVVTNTAGQKDRPARYLLADKVGHLVLKIVASSSDAFTTASDAEDAYACALAETGEVFCWGDDTYGRLGNGPDLTDDQFNPTKVGGVIDDRVVVDLDVGRYGGCAVLDDGDVACWGRENGFFGRLGNGAAQSSDAASTVFVQRGVVDKNALTVVAGDDYGCARLTSNQVSCWGRANTGSLGIGETTQTQFDEPMSPLAGDLLTNNAVALSGESRFNCAFTTSNNLACWGANSLGNFYRSPFLVADSTLDVVDFHVGWRAKVWAWLADGTLVSNLGGGFVLNAFPLNGVIETPVSIASGQTHRCLLDGRGAVACSGSDRFGQMGDGPDQNDRLNGIQITHLPW